MKRNMKVEVVNHRLLSSSSSVGPSVQLRAKVMLYSEGEVKKRRWSGLDVCVFILWCSVFIHVHM